jgi:hypothetical protein
MDARGRGGHRGELPAAQAQPAGGANDALSPGSYARRGRRHRCANKAVVPRGGLPQSKENKGLPKSGTQKLPTVWLRFLPAVSHRDLQLFEKVAPSES